MTSLATLASRYAGRPLLMQADAAQDLANRLYMSMPGSFETGTRFDAAMRLIGFKGRARPKAFDDDEAEAMQVPQISGPAAYAPLWMGEPDDQLEWGMSLKDGIATLNLDTAIADRGSAWCGEWWHGYDSLDAAFKMAFEDDRVKGIFLRVDSPGGVVSGGLDVLTKTIREGREAAGGKPVWAYADCAASAAYWISAQCDRIVAPRPGLVGSIGAVIVHMENAVMLAKHGVKVTPIEFGAQKTAGAGFKPLDEEAAADLQSWVNQAGADFVAAVSEGRPVLTSEALLASEARVFPAYHADPERSGLDLQFVDEILSEADAFAALVAHVTPADPAADPAGAPASNPSAKTGANPMAKKTNAAAKAAARRKVAEARLALAQAEEDEAELEDEEDQPSAEDPPEDPDAEGEDDDVGAEGEGDDVDAEGEDDDVDAEGEDDDMDAEGEDDGKPSAKARLTRLAIMGLPEAEGQKDFAKALADQGLTVKAAKGVLKSAKRTGALNGRRDHAVRSQGGSGGTAKGAAAVDQRLSTAVAELNAKNERKSGRKR